MWSRRQPLANVGAVLGLYDGPTGCDLAFCVFCFRFRLLRRYLALWPAEVRRVCRLLAMVREGCPGHGPIHFLSASAAEMVLGGILLLWPGLDQVYLCLAIWLALFSISRLLFLMLGVIRLLLTFAEVGLLLDVHGSLQLLNSSHVRERDRALFRRVVVGESLEWFASWTGSKPDYSMSVLWGARW